MVKELIIWRGSQYSTKVIAALHTKGLKPEADYRLRSAPNGLEERKKLLPAPYTVPVLRWDDEIISGSDNICRFLDEQVPSAPPLYPAASDGEVRRLEEAAAALYWTNGWLSTIDPVGMEEWSGQRARNAVAKGDVGKLAKFAQAVLPQKTFGRVMHGVVQKDFRAFLRRRGEETGSEAPARLADERDSAKVLEEPQQYGVGDADGGRPHAVRHARALPRRLADAWHERRFDAHHRRRHDGRDRGVGGDAQNLPARHRPPRPQGLQGPRGADHRRRDLPAERIVSINFFRS